MVVIWSKAFNICLQSTTTPQLFPALSQLSTSYPPQRSHRVFKVVVLSHTNHTNLNSSWAEEHVAHLTSSASRPVRLSRTARTRETLDGLTPQRSLAQASGSP